jgi:hypothetical protein
MGARRSKASMFEVAWIWLWFLPQAITRRWKRHSRPVVEQHQLALTAVPDERMTALTEVVGKAGLTTQQLVDGATSGAAMIRELSPTINVEMHRVAPVRPPHMGSCTCGECDMARKSLDPAVHDGADEEWALVLEDLRQVEAVLDPVQAEEDRLALEHALLGETKTYAAVEEDEWAKAWRQLDDRIEAARLICRDRIAEVSTVGAQEFRLLCAEMDDRDRRIREDALTWAIETTDEHELVAA